MGRFMKVNKTVLTVFCPKHGKVKIRSVVNQLGGKDWYLTLSCDCEFLAKSGKKAPHEEPIPF